ncbi:hypothetical protein [Pleionea sediminis]|uniref:hypothetical protein n=1 Tax=Pleionea sediminis TaxID=2569479 RepID=UPI0011849863|nr:hypothetical protein [Pleionea sediminis]
MTTTQKKLLAIFIFIIFPMCLGALSYLISPRYQIVGQFLPESIVSWWLSVQATHLLTAYLSGQIADFMWAFSIASAILLIWIDDLRNWYSCALVSIVVGISYEFAQFLGVAPGTYTHTDIVLSLIAASIACLFLIVYFRRFTNEMG